MSAGGPHLDPEGCGSNSAAYVLGALSEDEGRAFRDHLQSCAVCREEVAALSVVADALPAAAPQLTAPSELKRRVMAAVREEAPRVSPRPSRAPDRRAFPALRLRPALAGLALAATVIALAVFAFAPGGGSGVRVIRADVLSPRASALLRLGGGHAELSIAGLPQSAPGRVYEVWLKAGAGQPQPTDVLFTVTSAGNATVGVPGSLSGVSEVLVTSERSGGASVPTRAPVIVAHLS